MPTKGPGDMPPGNFFLIDALRMNLEAFLRAVF